MFVDAAFVINFGFDAASAMTYQYAGKGSALCSASANLYKSNNAWKTTPEVGDQVFFYVNGKIDHTGLVVEVADGTVTTVEGNSGNSSDMVAKRTYTIGSPRIAGYGRPKWSVLEKLGNDTTGDTTAPVKEEPKPAEKPKSKYHNYQYQVKINLLKKGDYGPQVLNMQAGLKARGYDVGDLDGKFGSRTATALKKFQKSHGLTADGEFGGQSFNTLWNA